MLSRATHTTQYGSSQLAVGFSEMPSVNGAWFDHHYPSAACQVSWQGLILLNSGRIDRFTFSVLYHFHFKRIIKTHISNDARWQLNSAVCVFECECVCVCVLAAEMITGTWTQAVSVTDTVLFSPADTQRCGCAALPGRQWRGLIHSPVRARGNGCDYVASPPLFFSTIFSTVIYTVPYL